MHKITLLSIAALASLAGAAIAQTPEPEPAWRASALALVPAGYVAGDAYRTDEAAMTGNLAVYPANANDPKSSFSVLAPRQASSSSLPKAMAASRVIGRVETARRRWRRRRFHKLHAELTQKRADSLAAPSHAISAHGRKIAIRTASTSAPSLGEGARARHVPPPYRLKMGGARTRGRLAARIPHLVQGRLVHDRRRDPAVADTRTKRSAQARQSPSAAAGRCAPVDAILRQRRHAHGRAIRRRRRAINVRHQPASSAAARYRWQRRDAIACSHWGLVESADRGAAGGEGLCSNQVTKL